MKIQKCSFLPSLDNAEIGDKFNNIKELWLEAVVQMSTRSWHHINNSQIFFSGAIHHGRVVVPSPKIVINLSVTYEKLLC